MNDSVFKIASAFVALAMGILACGSQTVSAPSPTPTPTPNIEPSHEIYAGFTDNNKVPFIMLHQSGEMLGIMTDLSNSVEGIVWKSEVGESIVVYANTSFLPQKVVIGEDVLLYSNYQGGQVDITIIRADGSIEMLKAQIDTAILDKIIHSVPTTGVISYSGKVLRQPDKWFLIKTGLYIAAGAVCISEISGAVTIVGLPLLLQGACGGFILESVIRAGNILNLDMGGLESVQNFLEIQECLSISPNVVSRALACANILADNLAEKEKLANERAQKIFEILPACTTHTEYICGRLESEEGTYNGFPSTFLYLACYVKSDLKVAKFSLNPLGIFVRSLDNQVVFLNDFAGKNVILWYPDLEFSDVIGEVDKYEIVDVCP